MIESLAEWCLLFSAMNISGFKLLQLQQKTYFIFSFLRISNPKIHSGTNVEKQENVFHISVITKQVYAGVHLVLFFFSKLHIS